VQDVDDLLLDPLACPFRRARKQRNPVLVVGEQIVDLEAERPADLPHPFEVAEYLAEAVVGAAQLGVAEEVQGDGVGEHATKRRQVTPAVGLVPAAQSFDVWMLCHAASLG
jgi:hypothetical protein